MTSITFRSLFEADLPRIADIDRSEVIRVGYEARGGKLVKSDVEWDVPNFFQEGSGDHTVAEQISFCRRHFESGAEAVGAFDSEKLVGIGLITPEIQPGLAQLAYLQVSSAYRRGGVGRQIIESLLSRAQAWGERHSFSEFTMLGGFPGSNLQQPENPQIRTKSMPTPSLPTLAAWRHNLQHRGTCLHEDSILHSDKSRRFHRHRG